MAEEIVLYLVPKTRRSPVLLKFVLSMVTIVTGALLVHAVKPAVVVRGSEQGNVIIPPLWERVEIVPDLVLLLTLYLATQNRVQSAEGTLLGLSLVHAQSHVRLVLSIGAVTVQIPHLDQEVKTARV